MGDKQVAASHGLAVCTCGEKIKLEPEGPSVNPAPAGRDSFAPVFSPRRFCTHVLVVGEDRASGPLSGST
jgi:hypothetical protein